MEIVFKKTPTLKDCPTHYCPGCGHGIAHRLIAETIDELDIKGRTIGIAPVGCAVLAYDYLDVDMIEVAHGRAPAVATGMKRCNPDKIIFSYQGDGDLASIGLAEIMHVAHRGERLTVIFINNAIYGMTGGQMAPTTLVGQVTTTSPHGRQADNQGYPMQVTELMSFFPGTIYAQRCSLHSAAEILKTKKAIKHAFSLQVEGAKGLAFVEVLSSCPTAWRMSPVKATEWVAKEMMKYFPLGRFKG